MTKAPETGIVSTRCGDCPENVARAPPVQAESPSQTSAHNEVGQSTFGPLTRQDKLGLRLDKVRLYSQGDCRIPKLFQTKKKSDPCLCCKREYKKLLSDEKMMPTRVIYFEFQKPKFGGLSVTADDYRPYKLSKREVPTWHPHRAQPWKRLDVPSVTDTTYRNDFAPRVFTPRRLPVRPKCSIGRLC